MSGKDKVDAVQLQRQIDELKKAIAEQMQAASKSGEVPFSQRLAPTPPAEQTGVDSFQFYGNKLEIPKALSEEIKKKGYVYRFINIKKFKEDGGVHRSYWRPYVPEITTVQDDVYGRSPEGYVTRGDCVLAVRSLAQNTSHKEYLHRKNLAYRSYNKTAKEELQKMLDGSGLTVQAGYDDSSDE